MVISCIDFFENYTMKIQNEIHNIHWHNFQVMNILVHVTYQSNPYYDHVKPNSKVLKEVHYYVSNDISHDTQFVQHEYQEVIFQHCMLFGTMVVLVNSKVQELGTLFVTTPA